MDKKMKICPYCQNLVYIPDATPVGEPSGQGSRTGTGLHPDFVETLLILDLVERILPYLRELAG